MTGGVLHIDVELALGPRRVFVALDVADAVVVAVVGPNGAGKTTLLRAIAGARRPVGGSVRLADRTLFDSAARVDVPTDLRGTVFVPSDGGLLPHLTAEQNVAFALACRAPALPPSRRTTEATSRLAAVGAEALATRRPAQLSGGERQRVALARALAARPLALLLDEPLAALDPAARPAVREVLRDQLTRAACPVLVVTHDAADAAALADRVAVLDGGRIVQQGSIQELRSAPASEYVRRFVGP